jgi:hypothetical protein
MPVTLAPQVRLGRRVLRVLPVIRARKGLLVLRALLVLLVRKAIRVIPVTRGLPVLPDLRVQPVRTAKAWTLKATTTLKLSCAPRTPRVKKVTRTWWVRVSCTCGVSTRPTG